MTALGVDECPLCGFGTSLAHSRREDGSRLSCSNCGWSTADADDLLFRLRELIHRYIADTAVAQPERAVPNELSVADATLEVPAECGYCGSTDVEVGFSWVPNDPDKNGVFVHCDDCGSGRRA